MIPTRSARLRAAYRPDLTEDEKMALLRQYHATPDPLCTEVDDDTPTDTGGAP